MSFKIKVYPEDFVVSEVINLSPQEKGEYSLYLLKKKNITTWEALGILAKKWRIPLKYFGYGGMKDKKALTYQYVTVKGGPKSNFQSDKLEITYLGKTSEPLTKEHLLGNNFEIIVREVSLSPDELEKSISEIQSYGLPNYFDEQRFSSVYESKKFPVKEIIKGNWEEALFLILAYASPDEMAFSQKLRECLKNHWKKWEKCITLAKLRWEKNLLEFLTKHRPSQRTFKRALHLIDQEYLFFLGNVYQSYLWNEVLKEVLFYLNLRDCKVSFFLGDLYFYRTLSQEQLKFLKDLRIPFPSPKIQVEDTDWLPLRTLYLKVFLKEGLEDFKELRTFIKGLIFKTYPRPALLFPQNLRHKKMGNQTYKISFFLEKGAYATLVIKRLFLCS